MGRLVWNTSRFVKVPGTNKRVRRARPENEWRIVEREELRIVDQELWQRVSDRLTRLKDFYIGRRKPGLLQRSATSSYLFSGLLKCGKCGGDLCNRYGEQGTRPVPQVRVLPALLSRGVLKQFA